MFRYKIPEKTTGLFKGLRLTMAMTAFIAGASFCFGGPKFHSSPVFYYINALPIPWLVYGVVLAAGGVCMLVPYFKPIGFLLGATVYTFFALTIWLAVLGGLHSDLFLLNLLHFPKNSVGSFYAACNATTISVLYWSALKAAIYAQVDPQRVASVKSM